MDTCRVETRTLELERRDDLQQRINERIEEVKSISQNLQPHSKEYQAIRHCQELISHATNMLFNEEEGGS